VGTLDGIAQKNEKRGITTRSISVANAMTRADIDRIHFISTIHTPLR
jgi:hypothetical protein